MSEVKWPALDPNTTFDEAIDDAISRQVPLLISRNAIITLTERILLKTNGATLRVIGVSDGEACSRPLIISSAHSLFQVGGRGATLILENLNLRHSCFRDEYKDIGAVVFCLHKAKVHITDCEILSDHGFGIWAVQRATVRLNNCTVSSSSRSGCVSFGRSSLSMVGCTIRDCKIHGVCSRGSTVLSLQGCHITSSGIRGLYAYHNVSLSMSDTTVTNTLSCDHAAVDLWGCDVESLCRDTDQGDTDIIEADTIDASTILIADVNWSSLVSDEMQSTLDVAAITLDETFSDIHIEKSHSEEPSPDTEYSRKFKHSSSLQNLSLKMVDCVICDNNGLGLRIRHGRGGGDGRISGSIVSCNLHRNRGGNVHEITDQIQSSPNSSQQQNGSLTETVQSTRFLDLDPAVGIFRNKELVSRTDNDRFLSRVFVWEYERDDPSINIVPNRPVVCPEIGRSTWQEFDSSLSEYIQSSYELYLTNAKAPLRIVSSASHEIENDRSLGHSNHNRNNNDDNDDDDDSDDDDGSGIVDHELQNCTVRLPEPFVKYVVDFKRMQQTNTHTHYMRAIRRRESQT
jgi:Right handed beta helix region/WWE domain